MEASYRRAQEQAGESARPPAPEYTGTKEPRNVQAGTYEVGRQVGGTSSHHALRGGRGEERRPAVPRGMAGHATVRRQSHVVAERGGRTAFGATSPCRPRGV